MDTSIYLVRVHCRTYNHSPFIESAMDGFCMQETTFPYICTIADDSSTDGEQDVIKRYLTENFTLLGIPNEKEETEDYFFLFGQHKTNRNCFFAVYLLKYNHYQRKKAVQPYFDKWSNTKYTAMCEGDDYWVDSQKLQMQVDFLESHPNHTLCIHAYRCDLFHEQNVMSSDVYKYSHDVEIIPDKDVINGTGMFCATASMLYRASATKDYPDWALRAPVGDRPLKFVLFARGHIGYINKVMVVYRVGVPGSWTVRINRKRQLDKELRRRFVQLLVDFDNWTNKKYHRLTKKAISDYKYACLRNEIIYFIREKYMLIKKYLN